MSLSTATPFLSTCFREGTLGFDNISATNEGRLAHREFSLARFGCDAASYNICLLEENARMEAERDHIQKQAERLEPGADFPGLQASLLEQKTNTAANAQVETRQQASGCQTREWTHRSGRVAHWDYHELAFAGRKGVGRKDRETLEERDKEIADLKQTMGRWNLKKR